MAGKSYTFRIRKEGNKYYELVEQNKHFTVYLLKTDAPSCRIGDLICAKIISKIKGTNDYLAKK